jgi:hypothetical protein
LATLPGIITSKTAWVLSKPGDRVTEHVFELQFPREILISLASGTFGTIDLESGPLDSAFIKWVLEDQSTNPPLLTGMKPSHLRKETANIRRLMWTLGNKQNTEHFIITSETLNGHKTRVRVSASSWSRILLLIGYVF